MFNQFFIILIFLFSANSLTFAENPIKWVFTDYPPANYKTENGEFSGFLYDIIIEAFEERMDIPVDISIFPWKRCQFMVQQGLSDMLTTVPTPERLEYAVKSDHPIWIKRRIIYTYIGHKRIDELNQIRGLEDIKDKNISVISYIGNGWIGDSVEKSGITVEYANSVEGMYQMLAAHRGDIIIEEQCIALSNIKNLGLSSKIVDTDGTGSESNFHIMIGKNSDFTGIAGRLDSVIEEMWNDGTIKNIQIKYTNN